MTPKYGAKVKVTSKLVRRLKIEHAVRGGHKVRKTGKYWKEIPFGCSGIYLGTRWLQNGTREYDSEYGYYFNPTERIKVALVSPGPQLNPIYVPLTELITKHEDNSA